MNIEEFREFCLSLKGTEEKMPFDEETLVFNIKGKMFCLTNIDRFDYINVKCEPEVSITFREEYDEVTPGYHMNKKHWNRVSMQGTLSDKLIKKWIKHSYDLVVAGLSKKLQKELKEL